MTHMSKTILFFGTEDFSAYTLDTLIARGYTIGAVITKPDTLRGRGKQLVKPQVKAIAEAHNIPVWQPSTLSAVAHDIAAFDQPVGVLVSYGKIIPQSIIDLFSPGMINLHPSLLPLYRGPSPIESAILQGDSQTGISIMQLSAAMDAGPVYLQETIPLNGGETAPELYESLGKRGAELLVASLPQIVDGTLVATPQSEHDATYCQLINKSDGIIDWHNSAVQIVRNIRAYTPWPGVRTTLGGIDMQILSAQAQPATTAAAPGTLLPTDTQQLAIVTADGILHIDTLKPAGKKEMPARAFLAGYRNKL